MNSKNFYPPSPICTKTYFPWRAVLHSAFGMMIYYASPQPATPFFIIILSWAELRSWAGDRMLLIHDHDDGRRTDGEVWAYKYIIKKHISCFQSSIPRKVGGSGHDPPLLQCTSALAFPWRFFFSFTLAGGMSMVVDRSIPSHLLLRMEGKKKN